MDTTRHHMDINKEVARTLIMTATCNGYITLLFQVCFLFRCSSLLIVAARLCRRGKNQNMLFWVCIPILSFRTKEIGE